MKYNSLIHWDGVIEKLLVEFMKKNGVSPADGMYKIKPDECAVYLMEIFKENFVLELARQKMREMILAGALESIKTDAGWFIGVKER